MTIDKAAPASASILVVGGGISGLTTTLEAAEAGQEVLLVEKNPYLGGRVIQLNQYFPKLCPPTCGLEINFRRIRDSKKIKVLTMTEVVKIEGAPGNYDVTLKISPRYVNENCTACGARADACESEIDNEFNFGMNRSKAAYLPCEMAFPARYVISPEIGAEDKKRCEDACKYKAVDFSMEAKTLTVKVKSVVWATGWKPYDATKIEDRKSVV
jgi:quinone-modifying oxidoreductase subunit QmoA